MTILSIGYTNAMLVFDRVMEKVLHHQILQGRYEPFINDIAAKPPSRSTYPYVKRKPKMCVIPGVHVYLMTSHEVGGANG